MSQPQQFICMVTLVQFVTIPGAHELKFQLPFANLPSKDEILTALSGEDLQPSPWTDLVENMESADILDYQDSYETEGLEFECIVDGEAVGKITLTQWPLY